jgi:hypothetical protein
VPGEDLAGLSYTIDATQYAKTYEPEECIAEIIRRGYTAVQAEQVRPMRSRLPRS